MKTQTKRIQFFALLLMVVGWLCAGVPAQEATPAATSVAAATNYVLHEKLKAIPGVTEVAPVTPRAGRGGSAAAQEAYDVTIEQPLDHQKPELGEFPQHFYVAHLDFSKPVVLNTEGYGARGPGGTGELGPIMGGANSVTVEHRYFGRSTPANVDWQYMTVKNAADDMHVIVAALHKIYTGKWVSTGTSKGGQTALFYKCYYPDDVNVTVAYVAPINVQQEDPRINHFIATIGSDQTRKKIKDYQIALFLREDELLGLIKSQAASDGGRAGRGGAATYQMGIEKAYEYGVLEFPYAFWQSGLQEEDIPAPDAPAADLLKEYNRAGTMYYYSDQGKKQFEPFLYEAFSEIGYYNYDITDFKQHMKALKNPTNLDICPDGVKVVYNPATMTFVYNYLQYKANNVIYIYGELDAWAATQMQLIGRTDAVKIVVKDGHHGARIAAFSPEQKEVFYSKMEEWLEMKVVRQ